MAIRKFASILVPRNGVLSSFLFRGRVLGTEFRELLLFCSTERNSKLFSLLQKGSELNSESFLFCFLFVFSKISSRFWSRVCAHALRAPIFLG
jgi:hypothetical protein